MIHSSDFTSYPTRYSAHSAVHWHTDLSDILGEQEAPSLPELVESIRTLDAADAFRPRFSDEDWRFVSAYLIPSRLKAGDVLIEQGSTDRTMYLLESGSLQVSARSLSRPAPPRTALLRAGHIVGELALFGDTPRSAEVVAIGRCVVWALRQSRLGELRAADPSLAFEILRASGAVMSERMRGLVADTLPSVL